MHDPLALIERMARILDGFHQGGGFEHTGCVLSRGKESCCVHLVRSEGAWWESFQGPDVSALDDLIADIGAETEADLTEAARRFNDRRSAGEEVAIGEFTAGILWSLAEGTDCSSGALIGRNANEGVWDAARLSDGRVHFVEGAADLFNAELVKIHDLAQTPIGDSGPKGSLRAAEASADYAVEMTPELREVIEQQRRAFVAKFGQEPGPQDPLFFNPEADHPEPIPQEQIERMEAMMSEFGFGEEEGLRIQAAAEESGRLTRSGKRPGRNAPCPCGSGKKYKHCHGA